MTNLEKVERFLLNCADDDSWNFWAKLYINEHKLLVQKTDLLHQSLTEWNTNENSRRTRTITIQY